MTSDYRIGSGLWAVWLSTDCCSVAEGRLGDENHKRVERILRQEGLKVTHKQLKRAQLC